MKTVNVSFSLELPLETALKLLDAANGGTVKVGKTKTKEPEPDGEIEEDDDLTGTEEGEVEITEEVIGELVKEKVQGGKKAKVIALLTKFKAKATKVSGLKPAQYEDFYEALKKV